MIVITVLKKSCCVCILLIMLCSVKVYAQKIKGETVLPENLTNNISNHFYTGNKAPLLRERFIKLPVTAFKPGGWLKKQLELQRDGLTGHLGEISIWLSKNDNAWLNKDGSGKWGWEELPYWAKCHNRAERRCW